MLRRGGGRTLVSSTGATGSSAAALKLATVSVALIMAAGGIQVLLDRLDTPPGNSREGLAVDPEEFGSALGDLLDVNGDGFSELAVGAPRNSSGPTGKASAGAAYIFLGRLSFGDSALDRTAADLVVFGNDTDGRLGSAIATKAADLDGDGIPELAVGEPGTGGSPAKVHLIRGSDIAAQVAGDGAIVVGDADIAMISIVAPGISDSFGATISTVPDLDFDGVSELIVGAPRSGNASQGAAYIIFGRNDWSAVSGRPVDDPAWAESVVRIGGSSPNGRLGASVSGSTFRGENGTVIGAPGLGSGGAVFVFQRGTLLASDTLTPERADFAFSSDQSGEGFGEAVADAGNIDGDSLSALATGAPSFDSGRGRVLVLGERAVPRLRFVDIATTGEFPVARVYILREDGAVFVSPAQSSEFRLLTMLGPPVGNYVAIDVIAGHFGSDQVFLMNKTGGVFLTAGRDKPFTRCAGGSPQPALGDFVGIDVAAFRTPFIVDTDGNAWRAKFDCSASSGWMRYGSGKPTGGEVVGISVVYPAGLQPDVYLANASGGVWRVTSSREAWGLYAPLAAFNSTFIPVTGIDAVPSLTAPSNPSVFLLTRAGDVFQVDSNTDPSFERFGTGDFGPGAGPYFGIDVTGRRLGATDLKIKVFILNDMGRAFVSVRRDSNWVEVSKSFQVLPPGEYADLLSTRGRSVSAGDRVIVLGDGGNVLTSEGENGRWRPFGLGFFKRIAPANYVALSGLASTFDFDPAKVCIASQVGRVICTASEDGDWSEFTTKTPPPGNYTDVALAKRPWSHTGFQVLLLRSDGLVVRAAAKNGSWSSFTASSPPAGAYVALSVLDRPAGSGTNLELLLMMSDGRVFRASESAPSWREYGRNPAPGIYTRIAAVRGFEPDIYTATRDGQVFRVLSSTAPWARYADTGTQPPPGEYLSFDLAAKPGDPNPNAFLMKKTKGSVTFFRAASDASDWGRYARGHDVAALAPPSVPLPLFEVRGEDPGARFGASLAGLGLADADEFADLLVGAPGAQNGTATAGAMYFVTGSRLRGHSVDSKLFNVALFDPGSGGGSAVAGGAFAGADVLAGGGPSFTSGGVQVGSVRTVSALTAAPDSNEARAARQFVSSQTGIPMDRLRVAAQSPDTRYPLQNLSVWSGKVEDTATGASFSVLLDAAGSVRNESLLLDAEKQAYRASFGKKSPELDDALRGMNDTDLLSLVIAGPPLDGFPSQQVIAARFPNASLEFARPSLATPANLSEAVLAAYTAELTNATERNISAIKTFLASLPNTIVTPGSSLPFVHTVTPKSSVPLIENRSDVSMIDLDSDIGLSLQRATPLHRAGAYLQFGGTGLGVKVADVEPGAIDLNHPTYVFARLAGSITRIAASPEKHATMVAGPIASAGLPSGTNARDIGMAHRVTLLSANIPSGMFSEMPAAISWAVSNGAHVLVMPLWDCGRGGRSCDGGYTQATAYADLAVDPQWRTVIVSAGNRQIVGTDFVTSPAIGGNVIAVGGIETPSVVWGHSRVWTDPNLNLHTSFGDPVTPNGDRSKPELSAAAVYGALPLVGGGYQPDAGTSFAAPMVAGLVAQMMAQQSGLKTWPEGVKAILLVSSLHVTVIDATGVSSSGQVDAVQGVGAIVASQAKEVIARNQFVLTSLTRNSVTQLHTFTAAKGQRVRVGLGWTDPIVTELQFKTAFNEVDLDLYVCRGVVSTCTSANALAKSLSYDRTWEVAEFTAPEADTYTIAVRPYKVDRNRQYYSVAWSLTTRIDPEGTIGAGSFVQGPLAVPASAASVDVTVRSYADGDPLLIELLGATVTCESRKFFDGLKTVSCPLLDFMRGAQTWSVKITNRSGVAVFARATVKVV